MWRKRRPGCHARGIPDVASRSTDPSRFLKPPLSCGLRENHNPPGGRRTHSRTAGRVVSAIFPRRPCSRHCTVLASTLQGSRVPTGEPRDEIVQAKRRGPAVAPYSPDDGDIASRPRSSLQRRSVRAPGCHQRPGRRDGRPGADGRATPRPRRVRADRFHGCPVLRPGIRGHESANEPRGGSPRGPLRPEARAGRRLAGRAAGPAGADLGA